MADAAVSGGMDDLGFTAHAAWPFASDWHLKPADYPAYVADIARLKEEFKGSLRVLLGFEADYIGGVTAPYPEFYARFAPDFLIGSVHYVPARENAPARKRARTQPENPGLWAVDAPAEEVARGIEACFSGDGKRAVESYWAAVRDMVSTCGFDIIGHLDVIRKRNGTLRFFDESAAWYRREIKETVKTIARSGKIVEINTGGIARKAIDSVYPSDEILALLNGAGVPITINSDAHSTGDLTCAYNLARAAARRAGYSTLSFRDESGWVQELF
jgi:histidinol-phosphatase (PHP family)